MARLTKAEFDQANLPSIIDNEVSDEDKTALIRRVYDWQENSNIYAWDEVGINEDKSMKDISIVGFILAGNNADGNSVAVEFLQPLDEEVDYEGVAYGFRLIMLQNTFYNLRENEVKQTIKSEETDNIKGE